MRLNNITTTACPECGCTDIKTMTISNKHSNGLWNERLEFACGLDLRFSPNFKKVTCEEDCERSDRHAEWKSQRKEIAGAMIDEAKRIAGKPNADLGLLFTRLRIDLDNYRDALERKPESDGGAA